MDPLMYNALSFQQRLALRDMLKHPGYEVQQILFEHACKQAVDAVIRLSPEEERYEELLKSRQLVARVTNEVCATLIKSNKMHADSAEMEVRIKEAEKSAEESEVKPLGEKFGSFIIKKRDPEQSNQQ